VTGSGSITSSPAGISCPADCSETYTHGTVVTLSQSPNVGYTFTGWSGACSGTGACSVTMDQARSVAAAFTINSYTVSGSASPMAGGTVSCTSPVNHGSTASCTVTPSVGYSIGTISGCGGTAGSSSPYTTGTIAAACTVAATFALNSYTLTVAKSGTGSGTVTSSPTGVNCGADCTEVYSHGTTVTLTAAADGSSSFTGWSGACSGTGACTVTMTAATTVTATFAINTYTVIPFAGSNGTITPNTNQTVNHGSTINFTVTPDTGYSASVGGTCGGSLTGNTFTTAPIIATCLVNATFTLNSYALTVNRTGTGTGSVSSAPTGIICGMTCAANYNHGTMVTLTATPDTSSNFSGWSGACSGTGACTVSMTAAASVTATFALNNYALTVAKTGTGTGTVTSMPAGINCGADCTETYDHGTMVTLSATPGSGSGFTGWSGGGCSGTGTCTVTMTAATTVTATFTLNTHTLSVTRSGTGSGTVTSSPAGINCGADCAENYDHGTAVTLTASPSVGSTFAGWSGGGCAGTGTCTVTMTAATTLTATFTLNNYVVTGVGSPTAGGTVTCINPVNHGETTTCRIDTNLGYILNSVSGCGGTVSSSSPYTTGVVTGDCTVTANFDVSLSATGAVSRKLHGAYVGEVSATLNGAIGGALNIEPRTNGTGHVMVFQFNAPVSIAGSVTVTTIPDSGASGTAMVSGTNPNEVLVTLSGITEAMRVSVALSGVNGAVNASAALGFLVGDINNTGRVTAADIASVKRRAGENADATNFRMDLNTQNGINNVDVSIVKGRAGTVLP
jgi:uncharacterized repeat protein (TIGR02543 family)